MPPSDIYGLAPDDMRRETLEKKVDTSATNRLTCNGNCIFRCSIV